MSQIETPQTSRRDFCLLAGVTSLLTGLHFVLPKAAIAEPFVAGGIHHLDLPDTGWRVWPDVTAKWKNDSIFLPGEFSLSKLPVNPPSDGWEFLTTSKGVLTNLPATVEQLFWGEFGLRPYGNDEYKYESSSPAAISNGTADPEVKNGAYYGVSWWWKEIDIPAGYRGKRILLHIRGARQRAEVYLNRKLVGYSVLEELPFECDLTTAALPGQRNQLAIRVTNPGGRFDWVDRSTLTWGEARIQKSHGFGGLDRGMVLTVHDPVRISDIWVLNTPDPHKIKAFVELESTAGETVSGNLRFSISDPDNNQVLTEKLVDAKVEPGRTLRLSAEMSSQDAHLWEIEKPALYRMIAKFESPTATDVRERLFGFRWFAPEDVGSNALFRLNGRRLRLYSSISWGYWPLNGLFPTTEFSLKEVMAAKQLNLNCLNFHRNPGKHDVLEAQDRLGLLRFMEPGGGVLAVDTNDAGAKSESESKARRFLQRYEQAKILHMIRTFRSHPSLIGWTLQNEGRTELTPELFSLLEKMHMEDPSRSVVANDGFTMRSHQAWYEPYGEKLHTSPLPGEAPAPDPKVNSAGGWWDDHQGANSDVWLDSHWKGPEDYQWSSKNKEEIVQWGEMEGSAILDNHSQILSQIAGRGGKSYDRADHKAIDDAYAAFLLTWGFRKAYPSTSVLYTALGKRCYETWRQYLENARICDENDYLAISGWESTAIENHSGIVDVFRNFKADPKLIGESLLPILPVAKQHALVYSVGEKAVFDLFFLNDTETAAKGNLIFLMTPPSGKRVEVERIAVPEHVREQFSYPVKMGVETPPLEEEGEYLFQFSLNGNPQMTQRRQIWVTRTDQSLERPAKVGLIGGFQEVSARLSKIGNLTVEPYAPGQSYDFFVLAQESPAKAAKAKLDAEAGYQSTGVNENGSFQIPAEMLQQVREGKPLFVHALSDSLATVAAKALADAGACNFDGMVGTSRAPWMGAWYFNREHPLYQGMPANQALGVYYQVKGNASNGWLVAGSGVEILTGYSRDHDRKIGAGTFTTKLGKGTVVMHRVPFMQSVLQQRFYSNVVDWLLHGTAS